MSDTVSAAGSIAGDGGGLTFLSPDSLPPGASMGFVHVAGASHDAPTSPGQIFQFATLTPDFAGLVPIPDMTSEPQPISGSNVTVPAGAHVTVVTFDNSRPVIIPGGH